MRFSAHEDKTIPRLSWCATLTQDSNELFVRHGSWVEHGDDFIVEGAWNDNFSSVETILNATVCAATGCVVRDNVALFFSPTDAITRLYVIRCGPQLFLSNSLAFILATSGERCANDYVFYEEDFKSIGDGLRKYKRSVPTASGNEVQLFYYCNIEVDRELALRVQPKSLPPSFPDFEAYRSFLLSGLKQLTTNASDPRRQVTFKPITTISKGYDSPTCAVLAQEVGCKDAITFIDKSHPTDPHYDCGEEIGCLLGMKVQTYEQDDYKRRSDFVEAEFLAAGIGGASVFLSAAEKHLERGLLFTGFYGDQIWAMSSDSFGPDINRGGLPSGIDLEEFRLRVGMFHIPVPFLGCIRRSEIHAISNQAEMAPWRLGTSYDRPICRRIVEEAGIGRSMFGQSKSRMSEQIWRSKFSEASLKDFLTFATPLAEMSRFPNKLRFRLLAYLLRGAWVDAVGRKSWRLKRLMEAIQNRLRRHTNRRFGPPANMIQFRFQWGVSKILPRYVGSHKQKNKSQLKN